MNRFRVWLRPSNSGCKVKVDGVKNAWWLLDRLSRSFFFKSSRSDERERILSRVRFRRPLWIARVPRGFHETARRHIRSAIDARTCVIALNY